MADNDIAPVVETPSEAPATPEIEYTGRQSVDKIFENAETEYKVEQIAKQGEVSVADLRSLPGAEKYTDAQLQAKWESLSKPSEAPKPAVDAAAPTAAARAWKAFKADGTEVTDFTGMSATDFLALQQEYNANGKAQRKSFDEIVRNAQLGHYNAEKAATTERERDQAYAEWKRNEAENKTLSADRAAWTHALSQARANNLAPLQLLVDEFNKAMDAGPEAAVPETAPMSRAEYEQQLAGTHVMNTVVAPAVSSLATRYDLPPADVQKAVEMLIERTPAEFMSPAKLNAILHQDMPYYIEEMKRANGTAAAPAAPADNSALTAKIAELEGKLAANANVHNNRVAAIHEKRKAAPSAVGSVAGANDGIASPDFEGPHDARKWLKGLKA